MKFSGLLLAAFVLSGCVMAFDKPGVPPGGGSDDLTDCEVEALNKVPASQRIQANAYLGTVSSVDDNVFLRERVLIQCMKRKGYTLRQ